MKQFEKIVVIKLYIVVRVKGFFLRNFRVCVIYVVIGNIFFVLEILNKGRLVIIVFCSLSIVFELKELILVYFLQITMKLE